MLVSDWFSVDARRDTGGDAMRCGAMQCALLGLGIGSQASVPPAGGLRYPYLP